MDKLTYLKLTTATLGTVISGIVGGLGLAFSVLLIMLAADILTGLMVAWQNGEVKSSEFRRGLIRKFYIIILIGICFLLDMVTFKTGMLGDGVCVAYIVMEFISITENGGKLGVPIPQKVKDAIAVLKGNQDNKKGQN
ncbi:MAG: phage holin family protein [Bacillota bacterium]